MSQDLPPDPVATLQAAAIHTRDLVTGLAPGQLLAPSYASEWTIADALSHLGSGAVIIGQGIEDSIAGRPPDPDFNPSVWDTWNAKQPTDQAADFLAADQALLDRIASLSPEEAATVRLPFGPITLDLDGVARARLNEHTLHTWDVEVAIDPTATLLPSSTAVVVDNLGLIAGFAGKPTGTVHDLIVRTVNPERTFTLSLGTDSVTLQPADSAATPELELPAEALIRLIYGRLDPAHTPPFSGAADLDELRRTFPGL